MRFRKYLIRSWLSWSLVFIGIVYYTWTDLETFDWAFFWFIYTLGALFVMNPLKRRHLHFTFHELFVFMTFFLYGLVPALLMGQLLLLTFQARAFNRKVGRRRFLHFYPLNTLIEAMILVIPGLVYFSLGGEIGSTVHLLEQGVALIGFFGVLYLVLGFSFVMSRFLIGERIPLPIMWRLLRFDWLVISLELLFTMVALEAFQLFGYVGLMATFLLLSILKMGLSKATQTEETQSKIDQVERLKEQLYRVDSEALLIEKFWNGLREVVEVERGWLQINRDGDQTFYDVRGRKAEAVTDAYTLERHRDASEPYFLYDSLHEWHPELQLNQSELHHSALVIQPVTSTTNAVSCMISTTANGAYDEALAVEIHRLLKTLSWSLERIDERDRLQHESLTDPLTGLPNQRALKRWTKERLNDVASYPLSVFLIDLDHFKSINDTYGHAFGDEVLIEAGVLFNRLVRSSDLVTRYGGEEFVFVFPRTNEAAGIVTGEKIRQALRSHPFGTEGIRVQVTASIGIETIHEYEELDTVLRHADRAMYVGAKFNGRDRVAHYRDTSTERIQ
ncbi:MULTISPECIES: GGDEF domain-containing protein [unclassified Exiguobacterium]|uniref:GGDEF domain-containing protein n=1 Tax=unclassified Exiguobacterium TaxID=2644629 RepID=UPI00103E7F2B|nr:MULTISPECIES: GGDEF domain-containing protein [unclassified Exiguobacterium]TCI48117.1 GGDEF domain-containing protein [Exiguobacterium sp. SH5S32]TCI55002.1 GGDEF domain-containing protein [Exiguobacterium sp. SH1S4]TCI74796.1 GGDEF domain-containing protein [Exiguobacterium sp. SH1S1]